MEETSPARPEFPASLATPGRGPAIASTMASPVPARPSVAAVSHSAAIALLDRTSERDFDALAEIAAQLCATPIATIAFAGADGWWLKSSVGLGPDDTSSVEVFLDRTLAASDVLVVA